MKPLLPAPKPEGRIRAPKPLQRGKRVNPRNDERAALKFEDAFLSSEYVEFVHSLGCCIPKCNRTDIHAAHVGKTRANGGRWFEIAPLCAVHHQAQEGRTDAINKEYGIDLLDIAAATALRWKERSQ